MKILFAAPPGYGLMLPVVPLAWAARAAGHEVLLATTAKVGARVGAEAGLPVADVFPDRDLGADLGRAMGGGDRPAEPSAEYWAAAGAGTPFGLFTLAMTEGTIAAGRAFGADLIMYTSDHAAGLLAAVALDIPAVEMGNRVSWSMRDEEFVEQNKSDPAQGIVSDDDPVVAPIVRELRAKLGLGDRGPRLIARIDPRAPSMGGIKGDERSPRDDVPWWPMRYVPYNGGAVLPDWAMERPVRPRVCLTLGTVVPLILGTGQLAVVLEALGGMDIDVILAAGDIDLSPLGPLPANLHSAGFLPLSAILSNCTMIVHHGGSGSTGTSLHYGVPQLALPSLGDDFVSAQRILERGVGLSLPLSEVDVQTVRELAGRILAEPGFARTAAEVQAELTTMPSPASITERLTG